ncbi:MAG: AAA family ATPase [Planctomycetota bacterium]
MTTTPVEQVEQQPVFEHGHLRPSSVDQLIYLIKARYPLIWITSPEEERVGKLLYRNVAEKCGTRPYTWSITEGFVDKDPDASDWGAADKIEPIEALKWMKSYNKGPALFVLRDFHEYVKNPSVKRLLRDLARDFPKARRTCVVLSPLQQIPPEIEKEFAVVDFDLPNLKDISRIMSRLVDALRGGSNAQLNEWLASFEGDEAEQTKVAEAALGLTAFEVENVLAKSVVQVKRFDLDVIHSEKEQIIRKSGILDFMHPDASFAGVGGLDQMKDWLRKRAKAFTHEAREFGLPEPRGILMLGIPGCGKSLMAKAVSSLWRLPLIRLDIGKVFGSLVGSSEEGIRRAIKTAESVAPCILWLDELEKGLSGTQSSGQSDGGTTARVFGTFITWLQEKQSAVFVIGTANNVKMLPPELLRKGRFDEIFFVDLPSERERRTIFEIHIRARRREPQGFDLDALVDATDGFSGSEVEQVVISALYDAFDEGVELNDQHLLRAVGDTVPLSRTMHEEIGTMRDWAKSRARLASSDYRSEPRETTRKIDI